MEKRKIFTLGLDINEVVYLRRSGKVVAARYLGLESDASRGEITTLKFYRADGIEENIRMCCGYLNDGSKQVYETIEDAIHQVPIVYNALDITDLTKDLFCFSHERSCVGRLGLGKSVWKWDGYKPQKVHKWHANYKITYDGEWGCEYMGEDAIYATEEECRRDNPVEVITF